MDLLGKTKLNIATAIKTHGVAGELVMQLNDMADPEADFAPGRCLITEIEGLDVPFFIGSSRPRGNGSMLVTFDDARTEEQAKALCGHTFATLVDPAELNDAEHPDEGLTAGHLRGYTVITAEGQTLGIVDDITELTPGCWYLQLSDGKLIPLVESFITGIDPEARTLHMDLPQGLAEL